MKITGHQTAHVFRRYDIGDVEKLRERLAQARGYVRQLPTSRKVTPLPTWDTTEQRIAK